MFACRYTKESMAQKINIDPLKTSFVKTTGVLVRTNKDVEKELGDLLEAVQKSRVYADGKTFVDLVPTQRIATIKQEYATLKDDPHFDLHEFISMRFRDATDGVYPASYESKEDHTPEQHVEALWSFLERRNRVNRGSLMALPYAYIVPGGRFKEQFYWDSYFIMLGLASEGKWKMVEGMIKNHAHQIRQFGYIPTANRSYLLSRSQPPFFSHMVRLLQAHKGKRVLIENLPYLLSEYRFWMRGRTKLSKTEHHAYRRVVQLSNGSYVNRYYDNKSTPRPESLREDLTTAEGYERHHGEQLFLHIRAAAESGWDFSSRWFADPNDMRTIHTTDIVPVDLNALLYHLELTIADAYKATFNMFAAKQFRDKAKRRQEAVNTYLWNETEGYYGDYDFHRGVQTSAQSIAGVFPLFVGMASQTQADAVARVLKRDFLRSGGLRATTNKNGQQWDAPNGWAPMQWVAVEGLRQYGHNDLADDIASRWLALNERVYSDTHKFIEKYNVDSADGIGSGGEYGLQDGFGWTNGVYEALKRNYRV